jgi:hypothetical protein
MSSSAARSAPAANGWVTDILVVLGIAVSLGLIAISAVLNFRVGYRTADNEFDGLVYGLAAALADGLKAIAPFVAGWGWRRKDYLAVAAAAAIFIVFSGYSFSAAMGFAAQHRIFKQTEQQSAFEQREDLKKEMRRIETRLEKLGAQRSAGEIEKAVAAVLARPVPGNGRTVGEISKGCTLNRPATRPACAEIADLNAEAERAKEYRRLSDDAKDLRKRLEGVKGGTRSGDAQLDVLQGLLEATPLKVERRHLEVALAVLVALLVELGSGLGLFIATTPWRTATPNERGKGTGTRKQRKSGKGTAMTCGAVEEFMLARVEPRPGAQVSTGDLFLAYGLWCRKAGLEPCELAAFKTRFSELAELAGVGFSGTGDNGVYTDVGLSVT